MIGYQLDARPSVNKITIMVMVNMSKGHVEQGTKEIYKCDYSIMKRIVMINNVIKSAVLVDSQGNSAEKQT